MFLQVQPMIALLQRLQPRVARLVAVGGMN